MHHQSVYSNLYVKFCQPSFGPPPILTPGTNSTSPTIREITFEYSSPVTHTTATTTADAADFTADTTTTTITTTSDRDSLLNCPHIHLPHQPGRSLAASTAPTVLAHSLNVWAYLRLVNQCLEHPPTAEIATFTTLAHSLTALGLFGHMRIHDSGIHRNVDNTNAPYPVYGTVFCTGYVTPCTPSSPSILTVTAKSYTTNDQAPASPDCSCSHCAGNFSVLMRNPKLSQTAAKKLMFFCITFSVVALNLKKKEAIIVRVTETVVIQHSLPGGVVCPDASIEVTKYKQAEAYQAMIDALRQTEQTSHDVSPDGKGDANVESLCLWPAPPKEGVAGTHLPQLTLLRVSGLAESCNIHLIAPVPEQLAPFQPVAPKIF
ncbi:unnamed protein product [Schistocephalus solidus]|uniref:Uncharacterized protein n=1 Tax=Schistocephalus solidus TaxID=70667 RepID=A0A183SJE9_SCHSO|nr:unnamed protein product [Schistocephalus solidus]